MQNQSNFRFSAAGIYSPKALRPVVCIRDTTNTFCRKQAGVRSIVYALALNGADHNAFDKILL